MIFKKNTLSNLPAISTASLPDIVFILLFFFMTVTTMKTDNLLVENELPSASETEELTKKDRIIEVYVGATLDKSPLEESDHFQIQMEDKIVTMNNLGHQAIHELNTLPAHLRSVAIVSIKADKRVKMGVIADIKKELQLVNLLKINYTVVKDSEL